MRRLAAEMAAQSLGIAKLFVIEDTSGANVFEGPCQLVMMGVAARQTVIIGKDLQLAFTQRRTVEMRKIVHSRAGGMHGRLVDKIYLAEQHRIARCRARHCGEAAKEWHSRRPVF